MYLNEAGSDLVYHEPIDFEYEPSGFLPKVKNLKVRKWALEIHSLWKNLSRKVDDKVIENPDLYTLLPLKFPMVIPGSRFREVHYWDSYWVIRGLLASKMYESAKSIVYNLISLVDEHGFLLNGARAYYSNRSQPPLLSSMVYIRDSGLTAGFRITVRKFTNGKLKAKIKLVLPQISFLYGLSYLTLSYVLGEIPSLQDRITVVRQLSDLTRDVLVLVEPRTPQGFNIISQMRSHILWLEKRRCRKSNDAFSDALEDLRSSKKGAFVVAPNTGTYCHFVQRMQRTSSQRLYKRSKGKPLRGFEDEKFCFVVLRRGQRSSVQWPLDDTKFETVKELRAKIPEEFESDSDDQSDFGEDEEMSNKEDLVSCNSSVPEDAADKDDDDDLASYNSDVPEDAVDKYEEEKEEEEVEECPADLGTGWGRIIFAPMKRGKQVLMHVRRSVKHEGSEGALERVIVTRSKNPALHRLAKKSFWGDLWPLKWEDKHMALSQQHRAAKSKSLVPPL
ncbi:hypothetical protein MKX01_023029 [Papaver californicum]|nr:hypothetical protein MKX01_023029 [Papaver californicum]